MSFPDIAPPQSDNEALRRIVARLDTIIRYEAQDYHSVPGADNIAITDADSPIRAVNDDALKTVVVNTGTEKVYIYESGKQVAIIYPEQTWESATTGRFVITGKCAAGKSSTVSVATYQL